MTHVIVVVGAGQIGQAIARRIGVGQHVLLADRSEANANAAAEVMGSAGYEVSVANITLAQRPPSSSISTESHELRSSRELMSSAPSR